MTPDTLTHSYSNTMFPASLISPPTPTGPVDLTARIHEPESNYEMSPGLSLSKYCRSTPQGQNVCLCHSRCLVAPLAFSLPSHLHYIFGTHQQPPSNCISQQASHSTHVLGLHTCTPSITHYRFHPCCINLARLVSVHDDFPLHLELFVAHLT
jgi:hypothetical protein